MPVQPVAIVTGAGSGIGRSVCRQLAEAGFCIALVGRTDRALRETAVGLGQADSMVISADLADSEQVPSVVDRTVEHWGRVDALVNNAGAAPLIPIDRTDVALLEHTFAVNTFGPALLIARVWPVLVGQGSGRIVNVSTMGTADPFDGFATYAASKAALESLTRSAANEGAAHGIRAFSVAPGAVETGMLRGLFSDRDIPAERTLDPSDVAAVICDCVLGRRDAESGMRLAIPSP